VTARSLRGFADGFVSVILASYLDHLGFSALQIGAIVASTLLGSAALTLAVGLLGHRLQAVRVLFGAAAVMFATGLGFAAITAFWPLLVIAFAGTLNPSAGDVSIFLPLEQAMLSEKVAADDRTALFARYNLGGSFAGAIGALASAIPALVARWQGWNDSSAERIAFVVYAGVAVVIAVVYLGLRRTPLTGEAPPERQSLRQSKGVVMRLSALFSLDSFGGGFAIQSLLVLWLFRRFDVSTSAAAATFFAAGLLSASSQLASSWLASRIGLIQTMVFTHLPSNVFLILAGFMPTAPLAIGFLLLRMSLSQMDVPARQSFVMAVVPPPERAAAASVTNVPRSLAAAVSPLLAGAMLSWTSFGWPLIAGGLLKIVYDLLLLRQFRAVQIPDEP
jgi:MFS family permease